MRISHRHNSHDRWRWWVLAATLAAFAWRVTGLDRQSLWRDEIDAVYFALRDLPQLLSMFVNPGQNGALYFLALRPWLRLLGTSEFALRYPSVLAGVLSVPLLWQVARRLLPDVAGQMAAREQTGDLSPEPRTHRRAGPAAVIGQPAMLATVFLVANPYQLWYAQEGKMYALVTFLALLAVWFWLRGVDRGGWRPWLGVLVTVTLAIYMHLLAVLLIPLLLIWFLLAWPQSKRHWRGFGLVLAGLTLPYLPLIGWQLAALTSSQAIAAAPDAPAGNAIHSVLVYQTHGILPVANLAGLMPFFMLGALGLLLGFRVRSPGPDGARTSLSPGRRQALVASWLIMPVISIILISLRQPVFLPRYVIWIAPAYLMEIAVGVLVAWQISGSRARLLAAALLVYLCGYWGYAGWQEKHEVIKTDLRGAVGHVARSRQPDELLILQIPHLQYAYRYYTSHQGTDPFAHSDERLGRWTGGIWTTAEMDDDEARARVHLDMQQRTDGAARIWVIESERDMRDPGNLMGEWLELNATMMSQVEFHGATATLYEK